MCIRDSTGIAPISLALAAILPLAAAQLLIDVSPTLRQAVDNAAASYGLEYLPGSSEGNRIFDVQTWREQARRVIGNVQLP